jgi:hypothetical protein
MLVPTVSKEFSHTQWWTINLTLFVSKENGRKDCEKRERWWKDPLSCLETTKRDGKKNREGPT